MSGDGLREIMRHYSDCAKVNYSVFTDPDDFLTYVTKLEEDAWANPIACLVCFESSKRHVTGFYFAKNDDKKIVYIFDTTGLTLPAQPCGYRGYPGADINKLDTLFALFGNKCIVPAVMPVNTVISIQNDSFSCLMATLLFFQGMRCGAFEMLQEPGVTETYGKSVFDLEENSSYSINLNSRRFMTLLYTTSYLPLLVGIQSTLGFLFMLDPLKNVDELSGSLVKLKTDWQRKKYDVFWQVAYTKLLSWFEAVHYGKTVNFPDFDSLCQSAKPREQKSQFEERCEEFKYVSHSCKTM